MGYIGLGFNRVSKHTPEGGWWFWKDITKDFPSHQSQWTTIRNDDTISAQMWSVYSLYILVVINANKWAIQALKARPSQSIRQMHPETRSTGADTRREEDDSVAVGDDLDTHHHRHSACGLHDDDVRDLLHWIGGHGLGVDCAVWKDDGAHV